MPIALLVFFAAAATALPARPITGPWPEAYPAKDLCSNCGLCNTAVGVEHVADACAFLGDGNSRIEQLEPAVHGRGRSFSQGHLSEAHFGVHQRIVLARGTQRDAQWTGVATGVALALLEAGHVDAVIVTGSDSSGSFAAPKPVLCRTTDDVLQGRRVKPSLSPALQVLEEVKADRGIRKLLFCGVGCAVQALRGVGSARGESPEEALGLEPGGLYVLGTHCVDNSPTPQAAANFISELPSIGASRAAAVTAYEFMADFKVHARVREEGEQEEVTIKQAYMTLPPSIGIPSIADSCYSCFDYTNGLADLVVGYMGAPFDAGDEMQTAPLMVTVRNARGAAMLDAAVAASRVSVLVEGGHGGAALPSSGDRTELAMQTARRDSLVQSLTEPEFAPADQGAPPWLGNILAWIIARGLPKGLEFGRYSIDYHFLRNAIFVERRMGEVQAKRHTPEYARAIMERYGVKLDELRAQAAEVARDGGFSGTGGSKGK